MLNQLVNSNCSFTRSEENAIKSVRKCAVSDKVRRRRQQIVRKRNLFNFFVFFCFLRRVYNESYYCIYTFGT